MTDLKSIVSDVDNISGGVLSVDHRSQEFFGENQTTGSKVTKVIGFLAFLALVPFIFFALFVAGPHTEQGEAARLLFIHLPAVAVTYLSFFGTLVSSIMYLKNRTKFWDLLGGATAEVGVIFCALLLFSGSIWGKPTWGTYWQWDPRLTSTAVLFVMFVGYLAVRKMDIAQEARSRRAAVLGIISFLNVIIVHYSIDWWRGLHQGRTFDSTEVKIEGWYLFSLALGMSFFLLIGTFMVIHKFRILWLEHQLADLDLQFALMERRSEVNDLQDSIELGDKT